MTGAGIAWTRGSAGGLSFCYAVIFLTVCRNLITRLRETALNQYIPFDCAITFHKIVAIMGGIFSSKLIPNPLVISDLIP